MGADLNLARRGCYQKTLGQAFRSVKRSNGSGQMIVSADWLNYGQDQHYAKPRTLCRSTSARNWAWIYFRTFWILMVQAVD